MNYFALILWSIFCVFLFILILIWGQEIINKKLLCFKEGLQDYKGGSIIPYPKDATIDYNNYNSPLYSHNVNLPINDTLTCHNFCGPKNQCSITREQCTSDVDCFGCNHGLTPMSACELEEIQPYDNAGKLGQNLGLTYSSLTNDSDKHHDKDIAEAYPGSKYNNIQKPYKGIDNWGRTFNKGIQYYNKSREANEKYGEGINKVIRDQTSLNWLEYQLSYPTKISATGEFYETTAPAANITDLNNTSLAN
jgi:hypothetical protein